MFTLGKVPFTKPAITVAFLALASLLSGCGAKMGFLTPDQLTRSYAKNAQSDRTYVCSLARFDLAFPDTPEKAASKQASMQLMTSGMCAPFSENYRWYQNTPPGPEDAAWGEPQNAPYRGHPELITRILMLRDDFKAQYQAEHPQVETMRVPVPTQQQLDAYQKQQKPKGPPTSKEPVPSYRSSAPGKYQEKPSRFDPATFHIPAPVSMKRLGPNQN